MPQCTLFFTLKSNQPNLNHFFKTLVHSFEQHDKYYLQLITWCFMMVRWTLWTQSITVSISSSLSKGQHVGTNKERTLTFTPMDNQDSLLDLVIIQSQGEHAASTQRGSRPRGQMQKLTLCEATVLFTASLCHVVGINSPKLELLLTGNMQFGLIYLYFY